jgi:hypothetical protein
MTEYGVKGKHYKGPGGFSVDGWFYGHSFHQLWEQFLAAAGSSAGPPRPPRSSSTL